MFYEIIILELHYKTENIIFIILIKNEKKEK